MHLAAKMPETARFAEKHAHEKKTTPSASIARRPSHRKMTKETTENAPAPLTRHPSLPAGTTPHTQTDIGWQPCNRATGQPGNRATGQPGNRATGQPDNRTTGQTDKRTNGQTDKRTNGQTGSRAVGHDTRTSGRHGGRKENRNVRKKAGARTFRTKENAALAKPRMGFSNGCFSFAVADHQVPAISL